MIKNICRSRWQAGDFVEHGHELPEIPSYTPDQLLKYEEYMFALPLVPEWETGPVIVFFPPDGAEDNELHTHPISDRLITVIEGSGQFIAVRNREIVRYDLSPGTRVWMPRGVIHTFLAGPEGMVVESIHNPFVPISDPRCLKPAEGWTI